MTLEEIKKKWSFTVMWHNCPCGGDDHYASRSFFPDGGSQTLSPILNCYITEQQWLIKDKSVQDIIKEEEDKYLKLLKNSEVIIEKVTKKLGKNAETLHFLWDTHGIPFRPVEPCQLETRSLFARVVEAVQKIRDRTDSSCPSCSTTWAASLDASGVLPYISR